MRALVAFHLFYYFKRNQFIIPLAVYAFFQYIIYGSGKIPNIEGYTLTCIIVFIFGVWTGFSLLNSENSTLQKLFVLHNRNNVVGYYISIIIAAMILCITLVMFNIFLPILLYKETDIKLTGISLIAQFAASINGVVSSLFFCNRIIKDKALGIIGIVGFSIISLSVPTITSTLPVYLSSFVYSLLPVWVSIHVISNFTLKGLLLPYTYFIVLMIVWTWIMKKKLF